MSKKRKLRMSVISCSATKIEFLCPPNRPQNLRKKKEERTRRKEKEEGGDRARNARLARECDVLLFHAHFPTSLSSG